MSKRVAVIGGGAAGATLVSELLARRTPRPLHLDWYTGSAHPFARGVAYGTSSEHHLLNVRAAAMGISAAQPQGFLDYAQGIDSKVAGADFLPRRLYGDYVVSEVRRAIDDARSRGHVVNMVPIAVDAVVPDADGVDIFVGETSSRVDRAVLCVGSLPPRPIPGVDPAAIARGNYVVDPWSYLAAAQASDEPRQVMLIGMGLT
ncbi:MAG TPA: FAD/NAD(P)-binding protein, partial [Pinirhizobacter sp.]|uniref:FAD/NAD(P)-binding protein n=1 Tax=Pinirhizobacter sp. TaxID=2950432 RepID=UPI002C91C308